MNKDYLLFTIQNEIVLGISNEFEAGAVPINLFDEQSKVKAEIKKRIIDNFFLLLTIYQQFGDNVRHILPAKFKKTATKKIKATHVLSNEELNELASECYHDLIEYWSDEIKESLAKNNKHVEEEILIRAKINEKGFEISSVQTIGKIVDDCKLAKNDWCSTSPLLKWLNNLASIGKGGPETITV
jgi:hypothetical protein